MCDSTTACASLLARQPDLASEGHLRRKPEFCLPICVRDVDVDAFLLPGEEEQADRTDSDDRGCHSYFLAVMEIDRSSLNSCFSAVSEITSFQGIKSQALRTPHRRDGPSLCHP